MLSHAVAALRCPVCKGKFEPWDTAQRALRCESGHAFDAAKQGYFNMLTGKGTEFEADSAEMVAARQRFLDAGHYAGLADVVAGYATEALRDQNHLVLDAGTGTGYYLHNVLSKGPAAAIGLDISKYALRRAARLNPQAANLVWDIWRPLPIADKTVDVVMVVFAPRNPAEFARVLRPGGRLIIVTPRSGHLAEIAHRTRMLGIEERKADRLADSLNGLFSGEDRLSLDIPLQLTGVEMADLAYMGPAGHHLDPDERSAMANVEGMVSATAKFEVSLFTAGDSPA